LSEQHLRRYSSERWSDESAIFVEAINRPIEKPIPRTAEKPTMTGTAIAQKRQGSPATSPQMKSPARMRQTALIIVPAIWNFLMGCPSLLVLARRGVRGPDSLRVSVSYSRRSGGSRLGMASLIG
jgi:hypothetical protein